MSGRVIWITGLSGVGKSALASVVTAKLREVFGAVSTIRSIRLAAAFLLLGRLVLKLSPSAL